MVDATPAQKWLNGSWLDFWRYVWQLAAPEGKKIHRIVSIHTGDVIDGNHHGTNQIMHEVEDQVKLALDMLQPIRDMSDRMYGILGTEAHAGNSHGAERGIYRTLQVDQYDYQLTLNIDGCILDVAHHSPMATLPAMYKIIADYDEGQPRPRYILRGDRHVVTDTSEEDRSTRMMILPSWQLKTSFGQKVSTVRRSDIGGLIINDGIVDTSKLRYRAAPDRRVVINV